MSSFLNVHILPREQCSWDEFLKKTPERSIALDGYVVSGPNWDEKSLHVNFDHHSGVVREATMSTAMQVYFAIKSGLMDRFNGNANVYINDVDQDTTMAIWLLKNYKLFSGTNSIPNINRLLTLNDRLDITGGAFPMSLDDQVYHQHMWVFQPYTDLRKSGLLATANETVMNSCLESILNRITKFMLGQAEEYKPTVTFDILFKSNQFKVVDETVGGIEARHFLFSNGTIDAGYVSIVSKKSNGNFVYTLGKRSRYVDFPLNKLYKALNDVEGFDRNQNRGWGGSDLIGGSDRLEGSKLSWEEVVEIINKELDSQN